MDEKTMQYTTVDDQIECLRSQNLVIKNETQAKESLKIFGYSNLIKNYRDPYTVISENKKIFRSGVTFEQLCSLYLLDKSLRNAVIAAMLDLEEHIKESSADVVASAFGIHPNQYLLYRNYQNRRKRKYRFTLPAILDKLNVTLQTDKYPICYYKSEYDLVPPWILFKSVYFSTIINFIDLFKAREQNAMVSHLYSMDTVNIPKDELSDLMMDTLFTCLDYRNRAAHGGQIYNYVCTRNFNPSEHIKYSVHGFSQLLFLLSLLKYKRPYVSLSHALQEEINRHCSSYPSDVTYLGQTLNIDIEITSIVFVSDRSKKYHSEIHCSGIQNARRIEYSQAEELGYTPCKRCCK